MYRIPTSLSSDIAYTEELIAKYKAGEITAGQLKSNRVPMGIYEQRKDHHHMLRVRCAGGLITPGQLRVVARVAKSVSASHLHLTTREEIQIHNVDLLDAIPSLRRLEKAGLATQGGGGNTVRNMTIDERSGLTAKEAFDVYPYIVELTSRLIAEADSFTMPRKYKVAFDISEEEAHSSLVADLGLIAKVKDGQRGFRVLIAGSTATNPHVGWEVFDFLPERELFRAAKALKAWFHKLGNRRNKHKARMRYVFYKLGEEEAKRLYYAEYEALKSDASLDFEVKPLPLEYHSPAFAAEQDDSEEFKLWKQRYAHLQDSEATRGKNLWYAYIPVIHGDNRPEFFEEVADYLAHYGNDVLRFTKREQFQVRNIPEEYLPNIYHFFRRLGVYQVDYPVIVNSIISCTGADTCRLGICLPKKAIEGISKALLESDLDLDAVSDIHIAMNGCTNICANATYTDLGFSGRIGRVGDDPYPAYTVWLPVKGRRELSLQQSYVPAKRLPKLITEYLRDIIAHRGEYADYYDYVAQRGVNVIAELTKEAKDVKPFSEEPDTYYDWGDEEKFSLIKYGQAECSAGLFDIIEVDQDTIAAKRKAIEAGEVDDVEKELHDLVFSENRMLLVTRGIDPRKDDDVYNGFLEKFIDAGIVPQKFRVLTELARARQPLSAFKALAFELADLLTALYKSMDDSLQFKVEAAEAAKPSEPSEPSKPSEPSGPTGPAESTEPSAPAPVFKDFRGVACPMNFVKTKIALAPLASGDLLEILLDDGQPINNVPGSVRGEGHTVVSTEQQPEGYWKVLIKKK